MVKFKPILFVMLWLAFYGMITKEVGINVNAQEPPSTSELRVYLPIIANQDSNASVLLQPEATPAAIIDVNASALPNVGHLAECR